MCIIKILSVIKGKKQLHCCIIIITMCSGVPEKSFSRDACLYLCWL